MSLYFDTDNWPDTGDTCFIIRDDGYLTVEIIKFKGSVPAGESGNVLIRHQDGKIEWVLGGSIFQNEERIKKAIAYRNKLKSHVED